LDVEIEGSRGEGMCRGRYEKEEGMRGGEERVWREQREVGMVGGEAEEDKGEVIEVRKVSWGLGSGERSVRGSCAALLLWP
jgi:hypothetical protein